jgi:hypothetical protein
MHNTQAVVIDTDRCTTPDYATDARRAIDCVLLPLVRLLNVKDTARHGETGDRSPEHCEVPPPGKKKEKEKKHTAKES